MNADKSSLFLGRFLCALGVHRGGEPVRYVVEDSFHLPDVAVTFCERCGKRASWRFV